MPNPALNDGAFQQQAGATPPPGSFTPGWGAPASELPPGVFGAAPTTGTGAPAGPLTVDDGAMRLSGTVSATAILLGVLVIAGWFGWQQVTVTEIATRFDGTVERAIDVPGWIWIASLVGLPIAFLTIFKPQLARITAPLYAVAQGIAIGAISHAFDAQWNGIVVQAVALTIAVFAIVLVLFATRTIRVTERMRMVVMVGMLAIAVVYLVSFIVSLFGSSVPMIHDSGPVGIGFSLVVVGFAAFKLLIDFDIVERGIAMKAPRYMEWYAAFGLLLTIIWLYMELLRLLAKLRQR